MRAKRKAGNTARFDESFLLGQMEKRKKWNSKGVKAGHGGSFTIPSPSKELEKALEGIKAPAASTIDAVELNEAVPSDVPLWVREALKEDKTLSMAVANKQYKDVSPHVARIAYGFHHPKELADTKQAEHWLQVRLFYMLEREYPELYDYFFAVPNGGLRTKKTASRLKSEGQKKGISDILGMVPKGRYHGMFLEVKTEKGRPTAEQRAVLERFEGQGYHCVVCRGFEACWSALVAFLMLPDFDGKTTIS